MEFAISLDTLINPNMKQFPIYEKTTILQVTEEGCQSAWNVLL